MNLEHAAEIAEARLVLRWACQYLTPIQRDCIENFLMGLPDAPLALKYQTTTDCIHHHRKVAMRTLRDRLKSLGIKGSGDVLSNADITKPKKFTRCAAKPGSGKRGKKLVDMTVGKCPHGHARTIYARRRPSGKLYCLGCQSNYLKTPKGRQVHSDTVARWRRKRKNRIQGH